MINFFRRKTYLVDELEGFIDIHNHILPGIDDGAQTVADSISLIKGFSEFGVNRFIATPHIMHHYHDNTPETIASSLNHLRTALAAEGLNTDITAAAEHMIDGNFDSILEDHAIMPLGKEHLLVEMSYLQPPINFDQAIIAVTQNRLFPILAHPERYNFLLNRTHKYSEFKEQGILFQLNMLSLGDYYGKEVSKVALKLLEEGMIDFIGSDVHNTGHLTSLKKISLSKKVLSLVRPVLERTVETFTV